MMTHLIRFGKKLPLPSTAQIKHELRMLIAADAVTKASTSVLAINDPDANLKQKCARLVEAGKALIETKGL